MTIMECPHCGKTIDKRGYNSHVRACAEKKQEQEDKIMKENEKQQESEQKEEIKEETETKNPKSRNWIKILAAVLGIAAAGIIGVLMLISPQSKESSKKESPSKRPGSRLNR